MTQREDMPEICQDCLENEWCSLDPQMWKCEYDEQLGGTGDESSD
ncbi:hypothetical protein [Paenibacillus alvei]|nr:hypothetical protein [Paenibacillus alvei]